MGFDRPIFVLGCPRSGTTLARLMLRSHPRIAIAPETRFVLSAYLHRGDYGDLRDVGNRKALAEWIVAGADTRFGSLGLNRQEVAHEIVTGPPTLGSAVGIALRAYARRVGKPRWGDKRPGYVQHIDALLRLFPDAQIIHVIRDGRDCVASLKRTPWWHMGVYHAIATWTQAVDAGREAARRLPADTYIETQFEHLVTDPQGELRRLCGFLGEEYAPGMSSPRELTAPEWIDWHAAAGEPVDPSAIGGWARQLERWEIELCEAVMTDRLMEYGYLPSAAGRPAPHHLARYAAVTAHRRLAARKRGLLDLRLRLSETQTLASQLGTPADRELV